MEGLQHLQGQLSNLSQQMDPKVAPLENQLASIPGHMQALYSVLGRLTGAINELGQKTVDKEYFDAKVEEMNAKTTANTKEIETIKDATKQLETKVNNNHQEILSGMNTEIDMRIKKLNNVVIFGLGESQKTEAKDKKLDDKATVNELLSDISPTVKIQPKTLYRAGKPSTDKTRPLIVVLDNNDAKGLLFKNVKNLKNNDKWTNVSIRDDKTKLQIHYDKIRDATISEKAKLQNNAMNRSEYNQGYRWVVKGRPGNKHLSKVKFNPETIFGETTMNGTFAGFSDSPINNEPSNLSIQETADS